MALLNKKKTLFKEGASNRPKMHDFEHFETQSHPLFLIQQNLIK